MGCGDSMLRGEIWDMVIQCFEVRYGLWWFSVVR